MSEQEYVLNEYSLQVVKKLQENKKLGIKAGLAGLQGRLEVWWSVSLILYGVLDVNL